LTPSRSSWVTIPPAAVEANVTAATAVAASTGHVRRSAPLKSWTPTRRRVYPAVR
jgi:hypothetical protein